MGYFSVNETLVTAKVEAVEAVAESMDGTNTVRVSNIALRANVQKTENRERGGGAGAARRVIGATPLTPSCEMYLRGAGAADVAPEISPFLRAAWLLETEVDATVPVDGSPADCTGGTNRTITVDRSVETDFPATPGALVGRPITITGNPATPMPNHIVKYEVAGNIVTITVAKKHPSATFSNLTKVVVGKCMLYTPTGTAKSLTLDRYRGAVGATGQRRRGVGIRGSGTFTMTCGDAGMFGFDNGGGFFGGHADVTVPTPDLGALPDFIPTWRDGELYLSGDVMEANQLQLRMQNRGTFPKNPNAAEAINAYRLTGRDCVLTIDPNATLYGERDLFVAMRNEDVHDLYAQAGETAGNRYALIVPEMTIEDTDDDQDREELMIEQITAQVSNRIKDKEFFFCTY